MSPSIKLMTLNIETDRHLGRILPAFTQLAPDVLCLQEVLFPDAELISRWLEMPYYFLPLILGARSDEPQSRIPEGVAVFAKAGLNPWFSHEYYVRHTTELSPSEYRGGVPSRRGIVAVDIRVANLPMRIVTTHHTITKDGESTEQQISDTNALFRALDHLHRVRGGNPGELVLCGDFNAPRVLHGSRGVTHSMFCDRYVDHIPESVESTLDPALHRVPSLQLVVDGVFSTSEYDVSQVCVLPGLSDHCAIKAQVKRV